MKAADITDREFCRAIPAAINGNVWIQDWPEHPYASIWDIADALGSPLKVALAKARKCRKRKLVDGCCCGCRGDFELLEGGLALIATGPPDAPT